MCFDLLRAKAYTELHGQTQEEQPRRPFNSTADFAGSLSDFAKTEAQ